jgi:hypothetical protein
MTIKLVAQGYDWRYPIGSKTQPACIYCRSEGPEGRPLCGQGSGARWTKLLASASKKRVYPIRLCPFCLVSAKEKGITHETKESHAG